MSQVTWAHVTCEVTFQMRDRKLDKPLGVEDEAKWPAKLLDSRYEIENGPRVFITKSNRKRCFLKWGSSTYYYDCCYNHYFYYYFYYYCLWCVFCWVCVKVYVNSLNYLYVVYGFCACSLIISLVMMVSICILRPFSITKSKERNVSHCVHQNISGGHYVNIEVILVSYFTGWYVCV